MESNLKKDSTGPTPPTEQEESQINDYSLPLLEKPKDKADAFQWLDYGNRLWRAFKIKDALQACVSLGYTQDAQADFQMASRLFDNQGDRDNAQKANDRLRELQQ